MRLNETKRKQRTSQEEVLAEMFAEAELQDSVRKKKNWDAWMESEEEPERWQERVPLQVAYKPEPEMPQNWQEEKPDVLQQGLGEQEWETVLQLAAFAPIRFGDVTVLLEIAPEEAQRLLDAMLHTEFRPWRWR